MKLYLAIEKLSVIADSTVNRHSVMEDSMKLYLKLKKQGKSHRSVIDRNRRDVREIENSISINMNETDGLTSVSRKTVVKSELIGLLVKSMNCQ